MQEGTVWNLETDIYTHPCTHVILCLHVFEMLRCEQYLELRRTTIQVNHQITKFVIGYNKAGEKTVALDYFYPFH